MSASQVKLEYRLGLLALALRSAPDSEAAFLRMLAAAALIEIRDQGRLSVVADHLERAALELCTLPGFVAAGQALHGAAEAMAAAPFTPAPRASTPQPATGPLAGRPGFRPSPPL